MATLLPRQASFAIRRLVDLRVGLDLSVVSCLPPTVNSYSYTFAGHPWIAKEWLGQDLLAVAYQAAGWNGVSMPDDRRDRTDGFLLRGNFSREFKPSGDGADHRPGLPGQLELQRAAFIFTFPIIVCGPRSFSARARGAGAALWLLRCSACGRTSRWFHFRLCRGVLRRSRPARALALSKPGLLAKWIGSGLLCPMVTLLDPYGQGDPATLTIAHGNEAVPFIGDGDPSTPASTSSMKGCYCWSCSGCWSRD